MVNILFEKACDVIMKNISGRKLVLRWKEPLFEKMLFEKTGLSADFYVSRDQKKINNTDTFSDKILMNKANEYFLVITRLPRNSKGVDR